MKTLSSFTATETVSGIPAFEAGYSYEYSLTIDKASVKLGSVKISDWSSAAAW